MKSLLDNDLYKFTQQWAVLSLHPDVDVEHRYTNRNPNQKFTQKAFDFLRWGIDEAAKVRLTLDESKWFPLICRFLPPAYMEYLANYRFDPGELNLELVDGNLYLSIAGKWHRTILWEVPLLYLISDAYFKNVDTNWVRDGEEARILSKAQAMSEAGIHWADFGTRRRRDFEAQDRVVSLMRQYPGFVGTSNVHLAHKYEVKPIGTLAHEFIMAYQVLGGIRHCNREALMAWNRVYQGNLGIALTDTLGTDIFFEDFDPVLSRLFDGVRQDSGDPFKFIDTTITHYNRVGIDPRTKTIIFSDSLDPQLAIRLARACEGRIKCSFGIGTNLTNDFNGSKALNIVIKLYSIQGIPVVKLSDAGTKAMGDLDAQRVTRWIVYKTPLDAK